MQDCVYMSCSPLLGVASTLAVEVSIKEKRIFAQSDIKIVQINGSSN